MRIAVLVLAGTGLAFGNFPAAAQTTARIETRPFYGAVVTIEEGVRVPPAAAARPHHYPAGQHGLRGRTDRRAVVQRPQLYPHGAQS